MFRIIRRIVLILCAVAACASVVFYTRATTLAQIDVIYEGDGDTSAINFRAFDKEDFKLKLTWKNNNTEVIEFSDEYITDGIFTNDPGLHEVTVEYEGVEATFQYRITVPEFDDVDIFVDGAESNNNENDLVYTMVYDGKDHYFDFTNLPSGATVNYEYYIGTGVNKEKIDISDPTERYPFKNVGSYVVSATLEHDAYGNHYNKKTATLVILPQELNNVTLKDSEFEFIGNPVDLDSIPSPSFKDYNGVNLSNLLNEVLYKNGKAVGYKYYNVRYVKVDGANETEISEIIEVGKYKIYIESKDVVTDADGKNGVAANYKFSVSADITVDKYYTVTFVQPAEEGKEPVIIPVSVKAGTAIPRNQIPTVIVPAGQKLMVSGGWDWNGCGHNANDSVNYNFTITAPTEYIEYSVTYIYYNGSHKTTHTEIHTVKSSKELFGAPEANGVFAGWFDAKGNKVVEKTASDMTLTAYYTFTYSVEKPDGKEEGLTITAFEPEISLTQIAIPGYQSTGWKIKLADGSEKTVTMPYKFADNNVTFVPQYNVLTYNIYFNGNKPASASASEVVNNLPSVMTFTVEENNTLYFVDGEGNYLSAFIPSLKSHTFLGWKDSSGNNITTTKGITGDVVIYAQWEVARIGVNYDVNGGSDTVLVPGEEFDYGSNVIITDKKPTRPGYDFIGWSENPDADYEDALFTAGDNSYFIDPDKEHPAEIIYYAVWKPATLTITYSPDGIGTQNDYWTYSEYEKYVLKDMFSKKGFTFVGWVLSTDTTGRIYKAGEEFALNDHVKFIAQWTPNVTFDSNDALSGPKDTAEGNVTGVAKEYPVDVYANGTIVLPENPYSNTLPYMEFIGWSTVKDAKRGNSNILKPGAVYQVNGDVTFYAVWEEVQYTVTFDYDYAGKPDYVLGKTETYWGAEITLGRPTRAGYVINGWYVNGTKYEAGAKYEVTSNVTFVAKWDPKPHTIVFNANNIDADVNVAVESIQGATGEKIKLPACTYTLDYHKFVGWSTTTKAAGLITEKDKDGNLIYTVPATNNENVNLYAIWEEVEYQLVFKFHGDNNLDAINGATIKYSDVKYGALPLTYDMMKVGGAYIFGGWCLDEELSITIYEIEEGMLKKDAATSDNADAAKIVIHARLDKATEGLVFSGNGKEIIGYKGTENDVKLPTHYGYFNYRGDLIVSEVNAISYEGPMGAFMYSSITSITFPENNNIKTIKTNAFANCANLRNVIIGDGVQTIESYAFAGCVNLSSVIIPESVTTVGEKVFYACGALTDVYCYATEGSLPIGWNVNWNIKDDNNNRVANVHYKDQW